MLNSFAAESTESSKRIKRAILLEEPPSLYAREITDKGSRNLHEVLTHRPTLVEWLYGSESYPLILRLV